MAALALRPYQEQGVAEIRARYAAGARRVLYQAPTGSGKTILFTYVVSGAVARGNAVTILGHRDEIVRQISDALAGLGVEHGIIAAGYPASATSVQVASVATLTRRSSPAVPDLLVIDEAHHAVASTWRRVTEAAPEAKILGVSATPERLDGAGLGDIFDTLVIGPPTAELIEAGYLSRFAAFMPARLPDLTGVRTRAGDYAPEALSRVMSKGVIIGSAVDEYARICPGAPAIAFCVDREHSRLVADRFRERGYRAEHVDGETPIDERRALITALGNGGLDVLANCGLISEGLDVPGVVAAILLRPTKSLALYLQQVGRALRPAPGKARAIILDHVGLSLRFGLPDAPRRWSLDGRAAAHDGEAPVRRCPACGAVIPLAAYECSECGAPLRGHGHTETASELIEADRELIEIGRLRAMSYGRAVAWAGTSEARLRLVARARGYKRGWIFHRLTEARLAGATQ
jgi:superfamily II DNA or RNA helicase